MPAKGAVEREFRSLPMGGKPVRLRLTVPRVLCRTGLVERRVKVGFADPKKSYTRPFARYAIELAGMMTLSDVAHHLQISWDIVKGIVGDDLQRRFARPKLRSLKRIAIGEICLGQRHKYPTIVMDPDRGAIVIAGDGKGEKSLEPFGKRLRHSRAKIAAVAAELSPAYSAAIRRNLPEANRRNARTRCCASTFRAGLPRTKSKPTWRNRNSPTNRHREHVGLDREDEARTGTISDGTTKAEHQAEASNG